jgi:hypothetical protein
MRAAHAVRAASVLAAAGAHWPSALCLFTEFSLSPYERALGTAWCGGAPQQVNEFLGHCPACWAGAAALILAALLVLRSGLASERAARAQTPSPWRLP